MTRSHEAFSTLPKSALGLFAEVSTLPTSKEIPAGTNEFSDLWEKLSGGKAGKATCLGVTTPACDQSGSTHLDPNQDPIEATSPNLAPGESSTDFCMSTDLASLLQMPIGSALKALRQESGDQPLEAAHTTSETDDLETTKGIESTTVPVELAGLGLGSPASVNNTGIEPGDAPKITMGKDRVQTGLALPSTGKVLASLDQSATHKVADTFVEEPSKTVTGSMPETKPTARTLSEGQSTASVALSGYRQKKVIQQPSNDLRTSVATAKEVSGRSQTLINSSELALRSAHENTARSTERVERAERFMGIAPRQSDALTSTGQPSSDHVEATADFTSELVRATRQFGMQNTAAEVSFSGTPGSVTASVLQQGELDINDVTVVPPSELQVLDVDRPEWEIRLVDRIAANLKEQGAIIELALTPENLGQLDVQIELKNGTAEVSFVTETREAARLISQAEGRLSDLLARHGFSLGNQDSSSREQAAGQDQHNPGGRPSDRSEDANQDTRPMPDQSMLNLIA